MSDFVYKAGFANVFAMFNFIFKILTGEGKKKGRIEEAKESKKTSYFR